MTGFILFVVNRATQSRVVLNQTVIAVSFTLFVFVFIYLLHGIRRKLQAKNGVFLNL